MRDIDRKVFQKIGDDGITFDGVMEIIDRMSKSELKKSFEDDCLFQSLRYFSKNVIDMLLRYQLIKKEGNKYLKVKKKKEEKK
ncbi:MAG: hypothetical protein K9N09_09990 [Candidatus Cloacimonetes bacterium]|nr:hypothetical protein [Candidatus Cloacimonadota bacterium]MCF7814416.1 hypothetical protein [Candidatus Cloacimonadota bacterium]MCF7869022.1 hypothetical protein [Candidatus Cloacimonadota bacterium]MCF7884400.1 hypothetical protein [Candidatus Cloacimonadota bacterium]